MMGEYFFCFFKSSVASSLSLLNTGKFDVRLKMECFFVSKKCNFNAKFRITI